MKLSTISKSLLLGLAVLLTTVAFASNKGSFNLADLTVVNGQKLPPGDYKVEWDGNGPNVQLNIVQGKKTVTTVPAHVVDLKEPASTNSAVVRKNDDGTRSLSEIRLHGKKFAFALGSEQARSEENTAK
ncbi:MAG TPA: hypothetical protein VFA89_03100 [Terriglobales bacterium]|nr:hypothetical protein [Terriglobales bacterium]